MTLSAIIIDDEMLSRKTLAKLIERHCPNVDVRQLCASGKEGHIAIEEHSPDLVFLDIEMPGINGFEMLESLDLIDFEVIFTTAYDEFALRAFQVSAIDYLLKPVDIKQLQKAIDKAVSIRGQNHTQVRIDTLLTNLQSRDSFQKIAIPSKDALDFVEVRDILRCEADKNYTTIYTVNGDRYIFSRTLKEIVQLLPSELFFRTHQSHLINLDYIKKYMRGKGGEVILVDGSNIPVSKGQKPHLMKRIFNK